MQPSSHDLFRLFDASPNPYLVLDRQLNIATANRAYLASVQRELADIVGRWAWDAFPTDDVTLKQAIASFERVIRTKQADIMPLLRFDVPRPAAEGGGTQKRYWSITHTPVFDDAGEVVLVLQNPIDVTSLETLRETVAATVPGVPLNPDQLGIFRRAEEVAAANQALVEQLEQNAAVMATLAAERRNLTQLFEQSPSFLGLLVGPELRIEFVNPKYLELVGNREVLGRTFVETLGDAVEQGYLDILNTVYATGQPYRANGARYAVQPGLSGPVTERFVDFVFQPVRDHDNQVTGIIVDGVDVTDRIHEQQRSDALERITQVIRAARDAVSLVLGAAEIVGKLLDASRVGYSRVDAETVALHTERDWTAPGVRSLAGSLQIGDFGSWIDGLQRGEVTVVPDIRLDPKTLDGVALEALHARSFLNIPVIENGKLVALFFVNKADPHMWQDAEIAFVREVAERTRTATERLSTELARQQAADELRALNATLEQRIEERSTALRLYQNIVRSDAAPVAAFDTSHRLIAFNKAQREEFHRLYGRSLEVGDVLPALLPPEQAAALHGFMARALAGEVFSVISESGNTATAARSWEVSYNPLRDEAGVIVGAFHHATDITDLLRAQSALADANASLVVSRDEAQLATRAKSSFLANMSHEIRTPMNAIIGLTHLLMHDTQNPAHQKRQQKIIEAAQHLLKIINNVLDISKVESGRMELAQADFSFPQLVEQAQEMVHADARAKGLALHIQCDEVPALLRGDQTRLLQVLINLLGNAVKFTDHGSISLTASVLEQDRQRIRLGVQVRDSGPGIPTAHQPHLFQPFTQVDASSVRQHGGTGLGLAVSKQIVQAMGGNIELLKSDASGSTFSFHVWLETATGSTSAQASSAAALLRPSFGQTSTSHWAESDAALRASEAELRRLYAGRQVLLAEDNAINAEIASQLLTNVGLHVDLATNGAIAVEMAISKPYDLILMDMQMPVLDGLRATREIRSRHRRDVPIIAMTANAFASDRAACLDAGMNSHLAKPVDPADLYTTLREWLSNPVDQIEGHTPAASAARPADSSLIERLADVVGLDVELGLRNVSGKPAVYERVLRIFANTYGEGVPEWSQLVNGDNDVKAQAVAAFHSVRGALATIGATELANSIAQKERWLPPSPTEYALTTQVAQAQFEVMKFVRLLMHALEPGALFEGTPAA